MKKENCEPIQFVDLEEPTVQIFFNGRRFVFVFRGAGRAATVTLKPDAVDRMIEALWKSEDIFKIEDQARRDKAAAEPIPAATGL